MRSYARLRPAPLVADARSLHTSPMRQHFRHRRWAWAAAALTTVAGVALAVAWWLPSDEALAARVASAAQDRLGVGVTVGALHWSLLPTPQVVLRDLSTEQPKPIRLDTLRLWPRLLPLLRGRVEIDRVLLEGGHVEQRSLRGLGEGATPPAGPAPAVVIDRIEWRDLTWVSTTGVAVVYAGEATLAADLSLQTLWLRRPGVEPATDLRAERVDAPAGVLRYALEARVGGGGATGQAELQQDEHGRQRLQGRLAVRDVEVRSALAAFHRRSPVSGQAEGETLLQAEGDTLGALARDLRTETRFTMAPATLVRFDLDRAVRTLGTEHQGETVLEQLGGRVLTRSTPEGMALRFVDLRASKGTLTASGQAALHARQLDARIAVDLVDGVIGVPVQVRGPLGRLEVRVDKAPLIGAAAGTAILPGVGTAIGAAIGRLFGDTDAAPSPPNARSGGTR